MGVRLPRVRRKRQTARPSIVGIMTSSTSTSGCSICHGVEGLLAVADGDDLVPLELQGAGDRFTDRTVVIGEQHLLGHSGQLSCDGVRSR